MLNIIKYNPTEAVEKLQLSCTNYVQGAICIYEHQTMVAHVVLYKNKHIGEEVLVLGNYTCVDKLEISRALFNEVIAVAKQMGVDKILGPMDGSTWNSYRFAQPSEAKTFLMEPQQEEYYIGQWEDAGFEMHQEYYSSNVNVDKIHLWSGKEAELNQQFTNAGIHVEKWGPNLDKAQWEKLTTFNNKAFAKSDFFSPITCGELTQKYNGMLQQIDTQFMYFAMHENELVGMLFAYPNLLDNTDNTLVLKSLAHLPSKEYKGLGIWLVHKLLVDAKANNYTQLIHALMKHDNASVERSKQFGGAVFKKYGLYQLTVPKK